MNSKILVTGVNGFVGKHLARELHAQGSEVIGVGREAELHPSIASHIVHYYVCDLTSMNEVDKLPLSGVDGVVSLAGLANVGASFTQPDIYNHINVAVLAVLGNKLLTAHSTARVVAISTGAVYSADQSMPLTEDSELIASGSPYALSKLTMEREAAVMRDHGLDCVIVRPFNHIGPGQEGGFLVPDLYQKIQEAAQSDGILKVGNLNTRRDYTDVRDVVKAYASLALAERLDHAVYNVCSGRSIEGERILEALLKETGQSNRITLETDPVLLRADDPTNLYGSNERLRAQTGWQPVIPLAQTIQDIASSFKA